MLQGFSMSSCCVLHFMIAGSLTIIYCGRCKVSFQLPVSGFLTATFPQVFLRFQRFAHLQWMLTGSD